MLPCPSSCEWTAWSISALFMACREMRLAVNHHAPAPQMLLLKQYATRRNSSIDDSASEVESSVGTGEVPHISDRSWP
jgi:hypothetical protein